MSFSAAGSGHPYGRCARPAVESSLSRADNLLRPDNALADSDITVSSPALRPKTDLAAYFSVFDP